MNEKNAGSAKLGGYKERAKKESRILSGKTNEKNAGSAKLGGYKERAKKE